MTAVWLSNTFLLGDPDSGSAVLIDAGGPVEPLLQAVTEHHLQLTHVLLTHHHHDHVLELDAVLEAYPHAAVLAHPLERPHIPQSTGDLTPGETIDAGGLSITVLHTPGHTAGMVALLVNGTDLFTGDTLFKGSVGGVHAPAATTYADLKSSILDTLLTLDPTITIHPGHTDDTTVADELESNPFVRIWRGVDPEGAEPVEALDRPATLILRATDYDGGTKAWVRWPDGSDDILPGSRVSDPVAS